MTTRHKTGKKAKYTIPQAFKTPLGQVSCAHWILHNKYCILYSAQILLCLIYNPHLKYTQALREGWTHPVKRCQIDTSKIRRWVHSMLWEFLGIHNRNPVMQHFSLNALFSNEDGCCGAYLGGYLPICGGWRAVLHKPMTHFQPFRRQSCFQTHSHWIQNPLTILWRETTARLDKTTHIFNTLLHSFLLVF